MVKNKLSVLIFFCFLLSEVGFSQSGFHAMGGVGFSFGSHKRCVFAFADVNVSSGQLSAGIGGSVLYYGRTIGVGDNSAELVLKGRVRYSGKEMWERNYFSVYQNWDSSMFYVQYEYRYYVDFIGTSQPTGVLSFWVLDSYFETENDFLAKPHSDMFRTATVVAGYGYERVFTSLEVILFTGDAFGKGAKTVRDSIYPSRFGYKSLENAPFGKFSAGIFSAGVSYASGFFNYSASVGIDSEHVRNAVQNKFMHDMWFLPKWLIGYKVPNYPMLQENGSPYLYKEGTSVRKSKLYYSAGVNDFLSY